MNRVTRHGMLVRNFLEPMVQEFERNNILGSFHFFYQGIRLELRLELDERVSRDDLRDLVKAKLPSIADLVDIEKSNVEDFQPESKDDQYGIEGWEIAKRVFEYGSRLSFALDTPDFRRGRLLHQGKLFHCMLNSLSYGPTEERDFYLTQAVERQGQLISQERNMSPENVDIEEAKQRATEHLMDMIFRKL